MKQIFILLSIFPLLAFAQVADSSSAKKIALGISFSPDYCYRKLTSSPQSKWIKEARDTMELPKFGFTTGVNGVYRIGKKISFETGILYADKGERTKPLIIINGPGQIDPLQSTSMVYHYLYLDIPLKIKYNYLVVHRFKFFVSAGISANLFMLEKRNITLNWRDGRVTHTTSTGRNDFSLLNLAGLAGIGGSYNLTPRCYLKAEPVYRRSLIPVAQTPVKGYLYSLGMDIGFFYQL